MADPTRDGGAEPARIMLGLLDSVERNGAQSQRHLAAELGIALGLVNAYLRRCIKKGLVKARQVPARRYVYYLTPRGFAEKSRLTVEYLSYSFEFFRQAKRDCAKLLAEAQARGLDRVALVGKSDLAEITSICALEHGVKIVGLVDPSASGSSFMGVPMVRSLDDLPEPPHAVIVTDLRQSRQTSEALIERLGIDRVLIPELLRLRFDLRQGDAA